MLSICCNSCVKSWRNKKDPQEITKTKPFINSYNWKKIKFRLEIDDCKNLRKTMQQLVLK